MVLPQIKVSTYDVDLGETKLSDDDLRAIEAEMRKIVKENIAIKPFILSREEAIVLMKSQGEKYKVEHIDDLPEDAGISFYKQGEYVLLRRLNIDVFTCLNFHLPRWMFYPQPPLRRRKSALQMIVVK